MELLGRIVLRGNMECKTGLHIGDESTMEIGGIDTPVVKDPITRRPYVPGSSIKGKLRSLLEWDLGVIEEDGSPHFHEGSGALDCPVCRIFGVPAETDVRMGPTRLSVRDAYPTDDTIDLWESMDTAMPYTEVKSENYLNRVTSEATPRDIERVPKGSRFQYELVYGIYDIGSDGLADLENLRHVHRSLALLEDSSLGGSGSRGYGKVLFRSDDDRYEVRKPEDYENASREGRTADSIEEIGEILEIQ